jgi:replicative DNA helicase
VKPQRQVTLTDSARAVLERLAGDGETGRDVASRLILAGADAMTKVPADTSAELGVVAALLTSSIAPDALLRHVQPEHFSLASCASVITAAAESGLHGQALIDKMGAEYGPGEASRLAGVARAMPGTSVATAEAWASTVRARHEARTLVDAARQAVAMVGTGASPDDCASELRRAVAAVEAGRERSGASNMHHVMVLVGREMKARAEEGENNDRLRFGWSSLDAMFPRGLRPGESTVVGARTSVGKSVFAQNVAFNAATLGHTSLIMSLEMDKPAVGLRLSSIHADRWPDASTEFLRSMIEVSKLPVWVEDRRGLNVAKIAQTIRTLPHDARPKLVVVDYVQIMRHPDKATRAESISATSFELRNLAGELGFHLLLLAQLNRVGAIETPAVHHLKDCGSLEEDADNVLLLQKLDGNGKPWTDASSGEALLRVGVAKQRDGSLGNVLLRMAGRSARIEEGRSR